MCITSTSELLITGMKLIKAIMKISEVFFKNEKTSKKQMNNWSCMGWCYSITFKGMCMLHVPVWVGGTLVSFDKAVCSLVVFLFWQLVRKRQRERERD